MRMTMKASAFTALTAAAVFVTGVPARAATTRTVHQGQSIQAAVNKSHPGDTVIVDGGVYRQTVTITTDGITLRGRGAVIEPPAGAAHTPCGSTGEKGPKNDVGICLLGKFGQQGQVTDPVTNVDVGGFTVRNFAQAGIWMIGGKNVVVHDNVATNNGAYGIARFISTGGRVEDNVASGSAEAGIYWGDSPQSNALVAGNHAYGNGNFGIFIRDSSHGAVRSNITDHNCYGIIVLRTGNRPVTDWDVQSNVSHHNTSACPPEEGPPLSGAGIAIAGADHVQVLNNSVSYNAPSGPSLASGGVVVFSTKQLGGANESNIAVHNNALTRNKPANITWDHQGTNIRLGGNNCTPSC